MIYQENLVGSIIGSIISTVGAILVWVILEKLKSFLIKIKDKKNFNKLYNLFEKRKFEPLFSIEISNLIDEIGIDKFLKVLRMAQQHSATGHRFAGYRFMNPLFMIDIWFMGGNNLVEIREGEALFNYNQEDKNLFIKERFLKYFRDQCEKDKMKIKQKLIKQRKYLI